VVTWVNPVLFPLIYNCSSPDIVIVHINPIQRAELPQTASEILNRINEISFNSSLMREMLRDRLRYASDRRETRHRWIAAANVDPRHIRRRPDDEAEHCEQAERRYGIS